jgi:N6-L-threonylcarbamoyladenine synthase
MKKKYILAIETSCDDTSIAISCNSHILSNVTLSSMSEHKKYGGIVPEIAARSHEKNLNKCFDLAIKQAQISKNKITHVVYTSLPGLPGSLHLGKIFAKSMVSLLNVPSIPVNHMHGHIFSFILETKPIIKYPFLSLVVSGGHTAIYLVKSINDIKTLTETTDDAIGETLDKIGRILKLSYPGGIAIDRIYSDKKTDIPMIHHFDPSKPFSFSGIKTHVLNLVNKSKMQDKKIDKVNITSSLLK